MSEQFEGTENSDQLLKLLEEAWAGSEDAWLRFVERVRPLLIGYARNLYARPGTASDIAQTTLMKVLQNAGKLDALHGDNSVIDWCRTVARNLLSDIQRRKQRQPKSVDLEAVPSDALADEENDIVAIETHDENTSLLKIAIASLTDDDKEILYLREIEGLSHSDIAERLQISAAAEHKRYTRAIAKCRHALAGLQGE